MTEEKQDIIKTSKTSGEKPSTGEKPSGGEKSSGGDRPSDRPRRTRSRRPRNPRGPRKTPKDSQESKEAKDGKVEAQAQGTKRPRRPRNQRGPKSTRPSEDTKESKNTQDTKASQESNPPRGPRRARPQREEQGAKGQRPARDSRSRKGSGGQKDFKKKDGQGGRGDQATPDESPKELFTKGKRLLSEQKYSDARRTLKKVYLSDSNNAAYLSYYGLSAALGRGEIKYAMELCTEAIKLDFQKSEFYENLARVYIKAGNKKAAVSTITKGIVYETEGEVLHEFLVELGVRQKPVLPFLKRSNSFNKALGILIRRTLPELFKTKAPKKGPTGTDG